MQPGDRIVSAGELSENNGQGGRPCWVAMRGIVYDVSAFLESHPGGPDAISDFGGRPIDSVFDGEHVHSSFARNVLEEYRIGVLHTAKSEPERRSRLSRFRFTSTTDLPATKNDDPDDLAMGTVPQADAAQRREDLPDHSDVSHKSGYNSTTNTLHRDMEACRDDAFLDLDRPLFPQLWNNTWTKDYYLQQVHIPRHCASSPAFFSSRWLNACTMMVWWAVPLTWIPVILSSILFASGRLPHTTVLALYVMGTVLWTLYEYIFHRFVFHAVRMLPNSRLLFMLHFTAHGVHHLVPMDRMRLVMPPLLLLALATPVTLAIRAMGVSWPATAALQAGTLSGYVAYDMLHYAFHHARIRKDTFLQRVKTHHMDHHYVDPDRGFGVSSAVWDYVFGTDFVRTARPKLYSKAY